MIPEIEITCGKEKFFANNITVGQYRKYIDLMEKNTSDDIVEVLFFDKKIIQEIFENRISLVRIGSCEISEFLTNVKTLHFIMQNIILEKILGIVKVEKVEKEKSFFDEYDIENGYEEQKEKNQWEVCRDIVDQIVQISIRLLKNSYADCMKEDVLQLIEYIKFELDTLEEK